MNILFKSAGDFSSLLSSSTPSTLKPAKPPIPFPNALTPAPSPFISLLSVTASKPFPIIPNLSSFPYSSYSSLSLWLSSSLPVKSLSPMSLCESFCFWFSTWSWWWSWWWSSSPSLSRVVSFSLNLFSVLIGDLELVLLWVAGDLLPPSFGIVSCYAEFLITPSLISGRKLVPVFFSPVMSSIESPLFRRLILTT